MSLSKIEITFITLLMVVLSFIAVLFTSQPAYAISFIKDGVDQVAKGNVYFGSDQIFYDNYVSKGALPSCTGDLKFTKNTVAENAYMTYGDYITVDPGRTLQPGESYNAQGTAIWNFENVGVDDDGEQIDVKLTISNVKLKNNNSVPISGGSTVLGIATHDQDNNQLKCLYYGQSNYYWVSVDVKIEFLRNGVYDSSLKCAGLTTDIDMPRRYHDGTGLTLPGFYSDTEAEMLTFVSGASDFHVQPNTWLTSNGNSVYNGNQPTYDSGYGVTDISYMINNGSVLRMSGECAGSGFFIFYKCNIDEVTDVNVDGDLKIVKFEESSPNGDLDPSELFDDTGETEELDEDTEEGDPHSKWVYNNGRVDGEYKGKTPPDCLNYRKTFTIQLEAVQTIDVTYYRTETTTNDAGETINITIEEHKTKYETTGVYNKSQSVTYNGSPAPNKQLKLRPYNLNRNGLAQVGDNGLDSSYIVTESLLMEVDNKQNITDNSLLQALDINNDTPFICKFNNDLFGMPDRFDWFTKPSSLANSSWEYATGSYANGRVGDMTDVNDGGSVGYYRFNLDSVQSITSDNLASLLFNNEEKLGENFFKENAGTGFQGGSWSARFVYDGHFSTDNDYSTEQFYKWWVSHYQQERFYEYGVQYKGKYDVSGFKEPQLVNNLSTPQATRSGFGFYTDGLTQRGLYVGKASSLMTQPVMCGNWLVKTIAGDIN